METYTINYEILKNLPEKIEKSKLLRKRDRNTYEDSEGVSGGADLEEEDLMEMLVEIFSMIVLKKKKNHFKLDSNDRNAILPHPTQLLKGRRKRK